MAIPIKQPTVPINRVLKLFIDQCEEQMIVNFMTQRIWPYAPYAAYVEKNKANERQGYSHSTGEGLKTFHSIIQNITDPSDVHFIFAFNEYLRYADLGVGTGTDADDVERSKKAHFKRRYVSVWDRETGRSHRPAIMMEMRHLRKRVGDYLRDYWGHTYFDTVASLEDIDFKLGW